VSRANRVAAFVDRILALGPVRSLRSVLDDYDAAGGGLLAAGLAFSSLFAILPAMLLTLGMAGIAIDDPALRGRLVAFLAERLPPLREFLETSLAEVARGGVPISIVALVGLAWGSSRFFASLDDAISRIFHDEPRRHLVRRTLLGLLSVAVLVGAVIAILLAWSLAERLEAAGQYPAGVGAIIRLGTLLLGSPAAGTVLAMVGIGALYRLVPTARPSWRAILPPAIAVGLALALFTGLFALIAPRLIGSLQIYGAFVAVFAAMIWLSIVAQAILIGASWLHRRVVAEAGGSAG
jgi:membrane protein